MYEIYERESFGTNRVKYYKMKSYIILRPCCATVGGAGEMATGGVVGFEEGRGQG